MERCAAAGVTLRIPPLDLCTDNGAMIAAVGAMLVARGDAPSEPGFAAESTLDASTVQVGGVEVGVQAGARQAGAEAER